MRDEWYHWVNDETGIRLYDIEEDYYRGYKLKWVGDRLIIADASLSGQTFDELPCGHCKRMNTPEGHDACLGTLPGLMNACCGHGRPREAYVQFMDGVSIHGNDAVTIQEILKTKRDELV